MNNHQNRVSQRLDRWDREIKESQNTKATGYGVRTAETAKFQYSAEDSEAITNALDNGNDRYIPDFRKPHALEPERSNLFEVPLVRYDPKTGLCFNDMNQKLLYVHKPGEWFRIGKEMPATQPVITHEFIEDALYELADKNKEEFEIVPEQTHEDKKGYRRYWGVLSKRLDTEIKDSFRSGDIVRFGAMVRNGINEQTSVGFDSWFYAIKCLNGSIGRGKELGSASWIHTGKREELQAKIMAGLNEMFDMSEEFIKYIVAANHRRAVNEDITQFYQKTNISDKYYDEQYFYINEDVKITDPKRITLTNNKASLWEVYNAITAEVWHSDDLAFGLKSQNLRQLNNQLVQMVEVKQR
jgi:hypothetical protein